MIETLLAFFAVGAIGFWLLLFIASIIFIAAVENDEYAFSIVATIILLAIYWKPLLALGAHWNLIAIFGGLYVVAGIAWSIWRWTRYVQKAAENYQEIAEQLKSKFKDKNTSENVREMEYEKTKFKDKIDVKDNKSRIVGWIVYWPWSAFWNITGDFFNAIYDHLKAVYQKIANKALAKYNIT